MATSVLIVSAVGDRQGESVYILVALLDVRACEDQPCLNNGTCVVYLRSFLCQCQKGYTGRVCEIGTYP